MRLKSDRAKEVINFFNSLYINPQFEKDLVDFFQGQFEGYDDVPLPSRATAFNKLGFVDVLIKQMSAEGFSAICKYKDNFKHILLHLRGRAYRLEFLINKLDSETLLLAQKQLESFSWWKIPSLKHYSNWEKFLKSPEESLKKNQEDFIEFLKWRLQSWKGIKEAKTLAEVISRASSTIFEAIPNKSQISEQLISLSDQLDQMIGKNLPTTGSLQDSESLSFLFKRYINAVTREEVKNINARKVAQQATQETKGSIKPTPSYRDKMHQLAICLLSQPELDKNLLTAKEWLMIGESLLLYATNGNGYLTTTKEIPDNEKKLPESALVESCHHLRRNAFRCFEQILPPTEEVKERGLEQESPEKEGAKNLFISYLGDLQFEDYENKSLLEDQDIQNKLTELDNRAKRVEDFTGWSTFSRALIDYLKEIKPGQETFKTAILKLKYHFELAAGKPDTQKAQQIAAKMKERIFAERNGSILNPSFPKLQQLFNLISVVCSPLAEEKKHEELKTSSSISLFSNPQQHGNDHKEERPLLNNTDLLSDSMEQKIDPAKTKMLKKLDGYIKGLEERSKSWFVIEETKKTLKEKQQLLSVLRQDLLSGCSKEELGSVINVITGNEATNTFCYRRGIYNSSLFFCCVSKTGTRKLIDEVNDFIRPKSFIRS